MRADGLAKANLFAIRDRCNAARRALSRYPASAMSPREHAAA